MIEFALLLHLEKLALKKFRHSYVVILSIWPSFISLKLIHFGPHSLKRWETHGEKKFNNTYHFIFDDLFNFSEPL